MSCSCFGSSSALAKKRGSGQDRLVIDGMYMVFRFYILFLWQFLIQSLVVLEKYELDILFVMKKNTHTHTWDLLFFCKLSSVAADFFFFFFLSISSVVILTSH